jgi:hypothetical protein
VQCVCLFLMMETTANSALIKIAVVIVGLDPAIHLFRKKMDARVNPRIKSGDAHDVERTAGGVQSRVIRSPIAGLKDPLTDGIRSEAGLSPMGCRPAPSEPGSTGLARAGTQ